MLKVKINSKKIQSGLRNNEINVTDIEITAPSSKEKKEVTTSSTTSIATSSTFISSTQLHNQQNLSQKIQTFPIPSGLRVSDWYS